MTILNRKILIGCVTALVLLLLILFALFGSKHPEPSLTDPSSSTSQEESPPDEQQSEPISGIPDLSPTDDSYEHPYEEIDVGALSKPTLTEAEARKKIEDFLPKLLALDPEAVEQVSPGTMMGEYNPFRLMLDVALADQTTGDAFRHMGELTEYEILNISYNPDRTNFIIVTLSVTTPYLNAEAQELAAGSEILALQEYTKFRESGAAKSLAGRSLNDVPLSTDLVELTFLVIDDEPILYYPESCMYDDDEVPQYAFFWGGIIFYGTNGGDLLLENTYGSSQEVSESAFGQPELLEYLKTALDYVRNSDVDSLSSMTAGDDEMAHNLLPGIWRDMKQLFNDSDGLEEEIRNRSSSLEYEIKTYLLKDEGNELGLVAVRYSTVDPITNKRVYNTRTVTIYNLKKALKDCGISLNALISQVAEDCWNGGASMARYRLNLLDEMQA